MQFESWVDRQIREAMERGAFENLPGAGKPLHLDTSEDWWVRATMKRENLEGMLPGPLALRREVAAIADVLDRDARTEAEARALCEDLNDRVRAHYQRPETGPRIIVRLVDIEAEVTGWRERRAAH